MPSPRSRTTTAAPPGPSTASSRSGSGPSLPKPSASRARRARLKPRLVWMPATNSSIDNLMLHIHRAERADALIAALGGLLGRPPADPFAPEVIAVPTRGMERWLTQQLSAHLGTTPGRSDGICANVEFPFPRALVRDAVALAADVDPGADPWLPERAVWPLLEVVGKNLDEPWLGPLALHL